MQNISKIKKNPQKLRGMLSILLIFLISGCSKKNENAEKAIEVEKDIYSYEVTCNACDIKFTDQNKNDQQVYNNNGKWSYSFKDTQPSNLKIFVKTSLSTYQNINAYILKNDDVIYGDLGYNSFEMLFDVKSGKKSISFGSYSTGSPTPTPGGGTTQPSKPTSSLCGARTKAGGSCQRVVSGGGRCWQHR